MSKRYKISNQEWESYPKMKFKNVARDFHVEVAVFGKTKSGNLILGQPEGWGPDGVTFRRRIVKREGDVYWLRESGSPLNSYAHRIGRD